MLKINQHLCRRSYNRIANGVFIRVFNCFTRRSINFIFYHLFRTIKMPKQNCSIWSKLKVKYCSKGEGTFKIFFAAIFAEYFMLCIKMKNFIKKV